MAGANLRSIGLCQFDSEWSTGRTEDCILAVVLGVGEWDILDRDHFVNNVKFRYKILFKRRTDWEELSFRLKRILVGNRCSRRQTAVRHRARGRRFLQLQWRCKFTMGIWRHVKNNTENAYVRSVDRIIYDIGVILYKTANFKLNTNSSRRFRLRPQFFFNNWIVLPLTSTLPIT